MTTNNHPIANKALVFAILASIGGALGFILSKQKNKEEDITNDIVEKGKEIAKKFKKSMSDIESNIKEIFGNISENLKEKYLELQAEILAGIDEMDEKKELTQKKYNKLVSDVVERYAKAEEWTEEQKDKLIEIINNNWDEVKN